MAITSYLGDGIKSIQRGTVTMDGVSAAGATITAVNMTKSILSVHGTGIIKVSSAVTATRSFQIAFTSSTQLSITSQLGGVTDATGTAMWQVVEYY